MAMTNNIPILQNAPPQIRLLLAKCNTYDVARWLSILQVVLLVVLPVLAAVAVFIWPDLKAFAAALSLIIVVADATFLDRLQKDVRRLAAKIQEEFDCAVLGLPWDEFTVGPHPDPEEVHQAATDASEDKTKLANWYPPVVGTLPLHQARIICQRVNLVYDAKLRARFGAYVLGLSLLIATVLFLVGLLLKLPLDDFVLTVLTPAVPIIIWGIREHFRQRDAAEASSRLKEQAEALWARVLVGMCDEDVCSSESRLFQNAIFHRRMSAPVIFQWVYKFMRPKMEAQVIAGAEELVRAAQAVGRS